MGYTVHAVLAAAYKGKSASDRSTLQHASLDNGRTALCGRIRIDSLADEYGTDIDLGVTCQACQKKVAKL